MIGRTISHYEVVEKLGEGGMGVVYKARDSHLHRFVALKVLPPDRIADPERKQRFAQEARSASALNHPNIITVHDIDHADGIDFIAMEYVEGKTLDEVIGRKGLKLNEALKYAIQIADALAKAHAAGIVHRDLKPGNVMVTSDGRVKVLDFGLAKLTDATIHPEDETRTAGQSTELGAIVGTASYMSPEQAAGRKVDARSDIFSFGLVLYEMLTGRRAFHRDTPALTLAAILQMEPPPLEPAVPRDVDKVVMHCLRKDPTRRYQYMADVKVALEDLKEESESGALTPAAAEVARPKPRWRWPAIGAAVVAFAGVATILLPRWLGEHAEPKDVPLASYDGTQGFPTFSPDGNQFAFSWTGGGESTTSQIYVRLVSGGAPVQLTFPPGSASYPAWSPDGQAIAFIHGGDPNRNGLTVIPALGGPERRIDATASGSPSWSPDAKSLYFRSAGAIFVAPAAGGEKHKVTDLPAGANDYYPAVSPDGKRLAFAREFGAYNGDLYVADLRGMGLAGPVRRLTNDGQRKYFPVWEPGGDEILFTAVLSQSDFQIERVKASGGSPPQPAGIGDHPFALAISPRGDRLAYSRAQSQIGIWRIPLAEHDGAAGAPVKLLPSTRNQEVGEYSPDGKRIAFYSDRSGASQIWVAAADGSNAARLTNFTKGVAGSPRWSPDGGTIVFDARPEGNSDVYTISAEGGEPKRVTDHRTDSNLPCYSFDGRSIYFASNRSGERQIFLIPASGGEAVQITRQHRGRGDVMPIASPEGQWVYYSQSDGSLWRTPSNGGEETLVLGPASLYGVYNYAVRSSGIYFIGRRESATKPWPIKKYRFADGKTVELGSTQKQWPYSPFLQISVSPDEKWMSYGQTDLLIQDIRMVENFR